MEVIIEAAEAANKLGIQTEEEEVKLDFMGRQIMSGVVFALFKERIIEIPPGTKFTLNRAEATS